MASDQRAEGPPEVTDGHTPVPTTVEEAVALLRKVADARRDYLQSHDSADVRFSCEMLDCAADIIQTGEVWPWVPTWRNPEFRVAATGPSATREVRGLATVRSGPESASG